MKYALVIWSSVDQAHITFIERIQNFLRICAFKLAFNVAELYHNYDEILNCLSMQKIQYRRVVEDLTITFKLLNGIISCTALLELISFN